MQTRVLFSPSHPPSARTCAPGLIALALIAATLCWAPPGALNLGEAIAADAKPKTIKLVIDYGDGAELHFTALTWRDGMTVLEALQAAEKHPHGVELSMRGTGKTALITRIGDVKNEGGGRDSRNWIYRVNGKTADIGAGARDVQAGDVVLWRFDRYDYNP